MGYQALDSGSEPPKGVEVLRRGVDPFRQVATPHSISLHQHEYVLQGHLRLHREGEDTDFIRPAGDHQVPTAPELELGLDCQPHMGLHREMPQ